MSDPHGLSWHAGAWQALLERYRGERAPHALLIRGLPGLGKGVLAMRLAGWLLCERRTDGKESCGGCGGCRFMHAGTHPDFHSIGLEEGKQSISVERIRGLIDDLQLSSHYGGWKVAIIDPADRMNAHSTNALLKTLEEPPGQTLLILVSARPSRLPATVRSRCQQVVMHAPPPGIADAWLTAQGIDSPRVALAISGGAPLAALELGQSGFLSERHALLGTLAAMVGGRSDPATAATAWRAMEPGFALGWLQTVVHDLIRLKQAGHGLVLVNDDLREGLQSLAQRLDLTALFRYLDEVLRAQAVVDTPVNPQLQMEAVLVPWCDGLDRAA